jgi:hypothetical protein
LAKIWQECRIKKNTRNRRIDCRMCKMTGGISLMHNYTYRTEPENYKVVKMECSCFEPFTIVINITTSKMMNSPCGLNNSRLHEI